MSNYDAVFGPFSTLIMRHGLLSCRMPIVNQWLCLDSLEITHTCVQQPLQFQNHIPLRNTMSKILHTHVRKSWLATFTEIVLKGHAKKYRNLNIAHVDVRRFFFFHENRQFFSTSLTLHKLRTLRSLDHSP